MLFMADGRFVDFIAAYMDNGQIIYSFNCGSGAATLTSPKQYNDNRWHTVSCMKNQSLDWELHSHCVSEGVLIPFLSEL